MKTEKEYQIFWRDIKQNRIPVIVELDPESTLVRGASHHQFQVLPVVDESALQAFEKRNGIKLPLCYRTFLKYFGAGGAGPEVIGIVDFNTTILNQDVCKPFLMNVPDKTKVEDVEDGHFIQQLWEEGIGAVRMATAGNPSDFFLILNGEAAGYVVWWNYGDMMGYEGFFDDWYQRWVDRIILKLKIYHRLKQLKIGMRLQEAAQVIGSTYKPREMEKGRARVFFEGVLGGYCEIDENEQLVKIVQLEHPMIR